MYLPHLLKELLLEIMVNHPSAIVVLIAICSLPVVLFVLAIITVPIYLFLKSRG